jgi:copper resistance protein D
MNVPLIVARAVYFAALLQLFGCANFGVWFRVQPSQRWIRALTIVVLLAMIAWLLLATVMMSGEPLNAAAIATVLRDTHFGGLWIAEVVFLICGVAMATWRPWAAAVSAAIVLILTAAAGHAGATSDWFEIVADAIHLLAVGAWIGGLVPFALAMRRPDAGAIAWRFSTLGTVCVALILLTGSINAWFLVGTPHALIATDYGRVLLLKLSLFVAMLAIAAVNRFRLTPRAAVATLRRNALIETALGLGIVAIVAALGTMAPGYYVSSR